jgi:hypothetical protein
MIERFAPDIWLPKHRDIILPTARYGLKGFYKIEAVRADGTKRLLADWFPNIITSIGQDQWYTNVFPPAACAVGSGNTTPAVTQTALTTLVASTTTNLGSSNAFQSSSPWFTTVTTTYQFGIGVAAGNLSEVGIGSSATALFSRALILDGTGNPTTITVLSSEALNVVYQLNVYPPQTDVTGNVTLNSIVYAYTLRAANVTQGNWGMLGGESMSIAQPNIHNVGLQAITSIPAGSNAGADSYTNPSYTSGTYTNSYSATWGINTGNFGGSGAGALVWQNGNNGGTRGAYQVGFSPFIPKTSSYILVLNWAISWLRM